MFLSPSGPDAPGNLVNLEHPVFPERRGTRGIKSEGNDGEKEKNESAKRVFDTVYFFLSITTDIVDYVVADYFTFSPAMPEDPASPKGPLCPLGPSGPSSPRIPGAPESP